MIGFPVKQTVRQQMMFFVVFVVCAVAAGCGSRKYEERLGATIIMFDHIHLLDKELQKAFRDDESAIQIRPPRGFTLIPAPEPVENEEGEWIFPELDERQPVFFEETLPGLIAAWKSEVTADLQDGAIDAEAHLFVFGNGGPLLEESIPLYVEHTLGILGRELGVELTEGALNEENFPKDRSQGFVRPVTYKLRKIHPERLIDGLRTEFSILLHRSGGDSVFVLLVIPTDVSGKEDLIRQFELSLETLRIGSSSTQADVSPQTGGGSEGSQEKSSQGGGF